MSPEREAFSLIVLGASLAALFVAAGWAFMVARWREWRLLRRKRLAFIAIAPALIRDLARAHLAVEAREPRKRGE